MSMTTVGTNLLFWEGIHLILENAALILIKSSLKLTSSEWLSFLFLLCFFILFSKYLLLLVGIHMGTNCAPHLAELFPYSY